MKNKICPRKDFKGSQNIHLVCISCITILRMIKFVYNNLPKKVNGTVYTKIMCTDLLKLHRNFAHFGDQQCAIQDDLLHGFCKALHLVFSYIWFLDAMSHVGNPEPFTRHFSMIL